MTIPPIIILGMHRSGTSLVARILQENGCFMGVDQISNLVESRAFVSINDWLLHQCNATWVSPENWLHLPAKIQSFFGQFAEWHLAQRWKHYSHPSLEEYLPSPYKSKLIWGWKDPRNSLTYKQWHSVFPDARFIHVYRNPIDAAHSLYRREIHLCKLAHQRTKQLGIEKVLQEFSSFNFSARSLQMEGCIAIWRDYVNSCLQIDDLVPASNVLHIRYEDLLENPATILPQLLKFCQLHSTTETQAKSIASINASRKFAFVSEKALVQRYKSIQQEPLLQRLGYSNIC